MDKNKSLGDEKKAFNDGFSEAMEALRNGDLPDQESLRKQFNELFELQSKEETVTYIDQDGSGGVKMAVTKDRSCAVVPAYRFFGTVSALLGFAKACQAAGISPKVGD